MDEEREGKKCPNAEKRDYVAPWYIPRKVLPFILSLMPSMKYPRRLIRSRA